ncbi:unnamed protein product [Sphacelaria rigidula]
MLPPRKRVVQSGRNTGNDSRVNLSTSVYPCGNSLFFSLVSGTVRTNVKYIFRTRERGRRSVVRWANSAEDGEEVTLRTAVDMAISTVRVGPGVRRQSPTPCTNRRLLVRCLRAPHLGAGRGESASRSTRIRFLTFRSCWSNKVCLKVVVVVVGTWDCAELAAGLMFIVGTHARSGPRRGAGHFTSSSRRSPNTTQRWWFLTCSAREVARVCTSTRK